MADKKPKASETSHEAKKDGKGQKQGEETVNLSAEELRKISGGAVQPPPRSRPS